MIPMSKHRHRHHRGHSHERFGLTGGGYYIGGPSLCPAQFGDVQTPTGDLTVAGSGDGSAGDAGAGDAGAGT